MSHADPGEGSGSAQSPGDDRAPEPDTLRHVADKPPSPEPAAAQVAGTKAPDPEVRQGEKKPRPSVVVRYGLMKQIGEFRHNLKELPAVGTAVVVRTERGVERGTVVVNVGDSEAFGSITREALDDFLKACGKDYPFRREGKVLRLANHQDIVDYRHLSSSGREEAAFCREQIRELDLSMRVVTVEHLLGGGRIIFYFAAESRVDFRELVRRLASQYHTRIEMRQVGARDEARLVADYERCGQRCCCQRFLQYLKPVSMRMAKTQKATLDPSKISGRCGRLMCCLRFEDAGYEALRKTLPRRNTWVRTRDTLGRVTETQILTQLVRLALPDNTTRVVSVEDIIERDLPAPSSGQAKASGRRGRRPAEQSAETGKPQPAGQPRAAEDESPDDQQPTRKRRRRRRKKAQGASGEATGAPAEPVPAEPVPAGPGDQPPAPSGDGSGGQAPGEADRTSPGDGADDGARRPTGRSRPAPKRRRRRRKKKKKKPSG